MLERYLEQAAFLHNGKAKIFKTTNGNMTLKSLCNIYLQHQQAKTAIAEITVRHHADQISCLKKFMSFIGQPRKISEISTLDLQNYKRKLKRAYNSAHRINLNISIMKTMFHWARKNDILDYIPNIDAVSSVKIIHKQRYVFTSEEIHRLFDFADVQMHLCLTDFKSQLFERDFLQGEQSTYSNKLSHFPERIGQVF